MPGFNAAQFCGDLYEKACTKAKERIGSHPKSGQLQMVDLFKAFAELKKDQYAPQFGEMSNEWNEAMAMIKAYTIAFSEKHLPHEIAEALCLALKGWIQFEKLPKEVQDHIQKAHTRIGKIPEKMSERISHFFNEMKVRIRSLTKEEQDRIQPLIEIYKPQMKEACQKNHGLSAIIAQLGLEIAKMATESSRDLQSFCVKTQHDLTNLQNMIQGAL